MAKTDRLSGGFGTRDLRSRLELDVAADGLFGASQSFRANTASVEEISGRRLRLKCDLAFLRTMPVALPSKERVRHNAGPSQKKGYK